MKRADADFGGQLPKRDWLVRVCVQIAARLFYPLFCPGVMTQVGPAAQTGPKSCRLRQLRRLEECDMAAGRSTRRTGRTAIHVCGGHRVHERSVASAIVVEHGSPGEGGIYWRHLR